MFEDSTFESTGKIKTRSRRWMLLTLAVNGTILAVMILVPLIFPDALPRHMVPTLLVAPDAPKPQPLPEPVRVRTAAPHDHSEMMGRQLIAPRQIPVGIRDTRERELPFSNNIAIDLGPTGPSGSDPFGNGHPASVVRSPVQTSIHLSSKLVEGNLIYKSVPQYPVIAKASHTEGIVVLQAMISKGGTIEGLHVISGSPMLRQAALDSVKTWRYRPYMLNGQAVEVETTVNVIFKLQ